MIKIIKELLWWSLIAIVMVVTIETVRRVFPPVEVTLIHYVWTEKGLEQLSKGELPQMVMVKQ